MPEGYQDDYFLFGCQDVLIPGEFAENVPLMDLMKRKMFKKFDNWVQQEYYKNTRNES
jgi:hypothetical protein